MQVNIRIEDTLYKKLRESAKNHRRTITAELDLILSNALDTPEKKTEETSIKPMRNIIEANVQEGGKKLEWN